MTSRSVPHRRRLPAASGLLVILVGLSAADFVVADENGRRLDLVIRDSFLPGFPVLARVELRAADGSLCRDVWDAEVTLGVIGEQATVEPRFPTVQLRNGIGSMLLVLDATSDIEVSAEMGELGSTRTLRLLDPDFETVASPLPEGLTEWSGMVYVPSDLLVPATAILRIQPGTMVLMGSVESGTSGADINIVGRLESLGTAERPVTFTAAGSGVPEIRDEGYEWGELHHDDSSEESIYQHTIITLAGNSPRGGHTSTGPAIRPEDSRIVFESCSITDTVGKIMQASDSDLVFRDTLFSRAIMGPEIEGTQLICENSYIMEMFGEDDNDGIYLRDQREGQEIRLTDCIVAAGDDDAIDTLGSHVTIEGCIVRDFADKGVSAFHETVLVSRCQIVDNDIGISCKTSNGRETVVTVEHCTIVGNRIGIEARNKGGDAPDARIYYHVTDSIIRHGDSGTTHTVRTDYEQSFIEIDYTSLTLLPDDWGGIGNTGNIFELPMFRDGDARNLHLTSASPCIDAGDPDGDTDPDGSRADMGVFPFFGERPMVFRRGEANGDGTRDIADAVTVLLFLFAGLEVGCADAVDADDNGENEVTDAIFLLAYLYAGGSAPPTPLAACGADPTEDDLACDVSAGCI